MKEPSTIPLWLIGLAFIVAAAVYTAGCAHQAFYWTEPDSHFSELSP